MSIGNGESPELKVKLLSRCAVNRNHPISDGKFSQASHRMNIQPAHDTFAVRLDGADANAKFVCDFFIALAFSDQHEHFAFSTVNCAKGSFLPPLVII